MSAFQMISPGFCASPRLCVSTWKEPVVCRTRETKNTVTARLEIMAVASRATTAIAATTLLVFSSLNPAIAIVSAPPCIKGEGPGCEARAAESGLIGDLLEKSRANREKNDKDVLEKYWQRGYGDYFSYGYNKELKKGEDGKWRLEDPEDLFKAIQRRIEALTKKDM